MTCWRWFLLVLFFCYSSALAQATRPSGARPAATQVTWKLNPSLPTVFLAGDSTAQVGDPQHTGWGKTFATYIDRAKANWVNAAIGGRSSRTYVTEGRWDRIANALKPGDFVLMQFGQNDGGAINDPTRARGSLPGLGDETQEIDNLQTHQHEVVHTFGWYMKKMVEETKAKGAYPILIGLTVRNRWTDGHVERINGNYSELTRQIAVAEGAAYIDLTDMVADRYEQMGADAVKPFFPADFVHTSPDGAALNAQYVLAGIKALHRQNIISVLSPAARAVNPATQPSVVLPKVARTGSPQAVANFLNWPVASDPTLPSIYLVGDSTVRNGRGVGDNGQWGWGEALAAYIDPNKANLVNRALGGTTSGSFYVGEWKGVADLLKKGDVVIMQFGTNGGGVELPGIGEETRQSTGRNGEIATSHTYGWFMRQMIADTRAKGATPIICTLVPRNTWKDGKISRTSAPADWARQIAKDQNVPLLDLYEGAAERYDKLGQAATTAVFADGHVHTNHDGAEILASVVVEQLKGLPQDPVAGYFRDTPAPTW